MEPEGREGELQGERGGERDGVRELVIIECN